MSLKGNLSSVNLTEIFQMLSLSGREGTLFIYEGARKRAICFTKEGVSIRSRERNESNLLGKILVRLGKIGEEDLARAVEERRATNKLLGDVLVESGACTRDDVEEAFKTQSEEDIQELFLNRSEAQFEYVDGYFPESDGAPFVTLSVNSLLIDIARRIDEWEYIRRRIRGPREIYRFTGAEAPIDSDVLDQCHAARIDPLIDGGNSVGDIIDQSYVNRFEVCKLLAAYLDAGIIELVPADAIRQNARLALRTGDHASAIRHYDYLMSTGDFPLEVMGEAAEAHEHNHDYAEAAAMLRRLGEELVRAGDPMAAVDALRRVANYPQPQPEALRFLLDLVFQHPRASVEFHASVVEAGKTLVGHYLKQEQHHQALDLLERLVKVLPDEVSFAVSLVNVHHEQGNVERAIQECERLANGFLKRKRATPAVSLYKKLLIMDPERQDIRERMRKIVSGRRRSNRRGVLPRIAVAVAFACVVGGAAVVYVKREPAPERTQPENSLIPKLLGSAMHELASSEEHGRLAAEAYDRLSRALDGNAVDNREVLLQDARDAAARYDRFTSAATKVRQLAVTIRKQSPDPELDARAAAMLQSLEALEEGAGRARSAYLAKIQRRAEELRREGAADYLGGRFRDALCKLRFAQTLAPIADPDQAEAHARYILNIESDIANVERQIADAQRLESEGLWIDARKKYIGLLADFKRADLVRDIRLPVQLLTVPPGASVTVGGAALPQATPAVVRLSPFEQTEIRLEMAGFGAETFVLGPFDGKTDPTRFDHTTVLYKAATWRRRVDGGAPIESAPAAWDDRVAVAARDGNWAVFDAATGRVVREGEIDALGGVSADLATDGRRIYMPELDGAIHGFDVRTWDALVIRGFRRGLYASPLVSGGLLYVVDLEGNLWAYDTRPGMTEAPLWGQSTSPGVRAAPVVHGPHVVVVSSSGTVHVVDRKTGAKVTKFQLEGTFHVAPAPADGDTLVFAGESGDLFAVDKLTGRIRWRERTGAPLRATPIVRGRFVFASTGPGELIAVNVASGDRIPLDIGEGASRARVAPTDRFFFANGNVLDAYAPRGESYGRAWTFRAEGRILGGPVVFGNAVYVADDRGWLYRLEAEDR